MVVNVRFAVPLTYEIDTVLVFLRIVVELLVVSAEGTRFCSEAGS